MKDPYYVLYFRVLTSLGFLVTVVCWMAAPMNIVTIMMTLMFLIIVLLNPEIKLKKS
ncbi:hypothetical protein PP178_04235 [Zeaxanthinibacter sp. PT1]|uniref:hypothetical protein n=1 Tax=Zeaxanthinibacter TaxID=561554 RepID=UPI00234943C9|nr:hypothetical protein [Zeaxanthinibacter sp. PT1]MDC6350748.1 hypothetical protein [Zeaxanthinibacter sp. PT1]